MKGRLSVPWRPWVYRCRHWFLARTGADGILHLLPDFFRQLLHFFSFTDHVERERVLVALVDGSLEIGSELVELLGLVADILLALLVGFLDLAVLHLPLLLRLTPH